MKESKTRQKRSGIIPVVSVIVMFGIATFAIAFGGLMIPFFLKIHLVQTIVFEYTYGNAQQALMTLMSLTKIDSIDGKIKPASKIVGEYLVMNVKPDISFLKNELDNMVANDIFKCYKLYSGSQILAETKCESGLSASKYTSTLFITTPDGIAELNLAVE